MKGIVVLQQGSEFLEEAPAGSINDALDVFEYKPSWLEEHDDTNEFTEEPIRHVVGVAGAGVGPRETLARWTSEDD